MSDPLNQTVRSRHFSATSAEALTTNFAHLGFKLWRLMMLFALVEKPT